MDDRGDDVESDGVMDLPPIATMRASTSQTTSRSASIARSAVSSVVSHVNPFLYSLEPHAPKTIKLLYIPDPTRRQDRVPDVTHDLSWVKRHLSKEQFASIQHLKGYYAKARSSRDDPDYGGIAYRMSEWVSSPPRFIRTMACHSDGLYHSCGLYFACLIIDQTPG